MEGILKTIGWLIGAIAIAIIGLIISFFFGEAIASFFR
jgi:hypothetical protein